MIADMRGTGEANVNAGLSGKLGHRKLAVLFSLGVLAALLWALASGPVLFRSRTLATAEHRSCWEYDGTGLLILNPFRSRAAERLADQFLRAASNAKCLPGWSEWECRAVVRHPMPAIAWRLVNRLDSPRGTTLFYALEPRDAARRSAHRRWVATIELRHSGGSWKIFGFGW